MKKLLKHTNLDTFTVEFVILEIDKHLSVPAWEERKERNGFPGHGDIFDTYNSPH